MSAGLPSDRLDGWKDIASYLNKSVRTAIRWEEDRGLPVRRLDGNGGEVVFAFKSEIDEWLRRHEPSPRADAGAAVPEVETHDAPTAPPSPVTLTARTGRPRWRGAWALVAALVILSGITGYFVLARRPLPPLGEWKVELRSLIGIGSDGTEVFRVYIDPELQPRAYANLVEAPDQHHVIIADLDGDGPREVVMRVVTPKGPIRLQVIEHDGRTRFTHEAGDAVTYNGVQYDRPFMVTLMLIDPAVMPAQLVIAGVHNLKSPAVVERLSARGDVLGEYWQDGHVRTLAFVRVKDAPLLAIGGIDDVTGSGSLALLGPTQTRATAPAEDPARRCAGCEGGSPQTYLLFPRSALADKTKHEVFVREVIPQPDGGIVVTVFHHGGRLPGDQGTSAANAYYKLSADLKLESVQLGDDFKAALARASSPAVGLLKPAEAAAEERRLSHALTWNGSRFVPVERVKPNRK